MPSPRDIIRRKALHRAVFSGDTSARRERRTPLVSGVRAIGGQSPEKNRLYRFQKDFQESRIPIGLPENLPRLENEKTRLLARLP